MNISNPLLFAETARTLGEVARANGWTSPGFRSPPRNPNIDRAIRRTTAGHVTVAVRVKDRDHAHVAADMIEGVIAANALTGIEADRARRLMRNATSDQMAAA